MFRILPFLLGLAVTGYAAPPPAGPAPHNLFAELLGKSETEISEKLDAAWRQLFYGDNDNQRVYYPSAPTWPTSPTSAAKMSAPRACPTA